MKLPSKKKKPQLEGAVVGDASKHVDVPKVKKQTDGLKVDENTHVAVGSVGSSTLSKKQKITVFAALVILIIGMVATLIILDANKKNDDARDAAKKITPESMSQEALNELTNKQTNPEKNPEETAAKARALAYVGNNVESAKQYDLIIKAKTATYDTYLNKALVIAATGDYVAAINALKEAEKQLVNDSNINDDVKKSEKDKIADKIKEFQLEAAR